MTKKQPTCKFYSQFKIPIDNSAESLDRRTVETVEMNGFKDRARNGTFARNLVEVYDRIFHHRKSNGRPNPVTLGLLATAEAPPSTMPTKSYETHSRHETTTDKGTKTLNDDRSQSKNIHDNNEPPLAGGKKPLKNIEIDLARRSTQSNDPHELVDGPSISEPRDLGLTEGEQASFRPPLTAPYLEIFLYEGKDGQICSGLSLTSNMIWEWNTVFRCEHLILDYSKRLLDVEKQGRELERIISNMKAQLDSADVDRNHTLEGLEGANEIRGEIHEQKQLLQSALDEAEEELQRSRAQLSRDWMDIMAENNLVEPFQDIDDPQQDAATANRADNSEAYETYVPETPTASETVQMADAEARDAAREDMIVKEMHLYDALSKISNWKDHYNRQYREYCTDLAEQRREVSKTCFDRILLLDEMQATRDLISAEREYEAAKGHALELGAVPNGKDQESNFLDHADDGYRESMEADVMANVDRKRIEKWMNQLGLDIDDDPECDDWDAKSVDLCDSISAVAYGKERKRIDRWWSMCEPLRLELDSEGDDDPTYD